MIISCQDGRAVRLGAPLPASVIDGRNLHRAVLEREHFEGAEFRACDLREARLALSSGSRASFIDCVLVGAEFQGARLEGAAFTGGLLAHADFSGANLVGATFSDVSLERVSFLGANFDGADLADIELGDGALTGALVTPRTMLPAGVTPASLGAVTVGYLRGMHYRVQALELDTEIGEPCWRDDAPP